MPNEMDPKVYVTFETAGPVECWCGQVFEREAGELLAEVQDCGCGTPSPYLPEGEVGSLGKAWRLGPEWCPNVVRGKHKPEAMSGAANADLIAYGRPDAGVTVYLYRCARCGVPLVGLGPLGVESDDKRVVWLTVPDAVEPEE